MAKPLIYTLQESLRKSPRRVGYTTAGIKAAQETNSLYVVHDTTFSEDLNKDGNISLSLAQLERTVSGKKIGYVWDHYALEVVSREAIELLQKKDKQIRELEKEVSELKTDKDNLVAVFDRMSSVLDTLIKDSKFYLSKRGMRK